MPELQESTLIRQVYTVALRPFADERGRFLETFRKEWFPFRSWKAVQTNRSDSKRGVLRGLHYHQHQVDYWYVVSGVIRVGLYDLRRSSPTCGAAQTLDMRADPPTGLYIPIGVAHGFLALTDVMLMYVVDNYYDSSDEYGVAWNDPAINIPWGTDRPLLSPRDAENPLLKDIPLERLPQ